MGRQRLVVTLALEQRGKVRQERCDLDLCGGRSRSYMVITELPNWQAYQLDW